MDLTQMIRELRQEAAAINRVIELLEPVSNGGTVAALNHASAEGLGALLKRRGRPKGSKNKPKHKPERGMNADSSQESVGMASSASQ